MTDKTVTEVKTVWTGVIRAHSFPWEILLC